MKNIVRTLTLEELKQIEVVSPNVSDKYVPIYTSDIIEILKPEFEFIEACQFVKGTNKHYADLINKDGDIIRIYNSYDRKLALSVSLVSDNINIDLGINRLIHIGGKAKEFTKLLEETKDDINESITTTKIAMAKFKTIPMSDKYTKIISDAVFYKEVNKKDFVSYTNYTDLLIKNKISVYEYIRISIDNFYEGNYTITYGDKKSKGRSTNSTLRKLKVENKVMKVLTINFPEFFL